MSKRSRVPRTGAERARRPVRRSLTPLLDAPRPVPPETGEALAAYLGATNRPTGPSRGPGEELVRKAVAVVSVRIDDEALDVAHLARALSMSPSQLGRRLRALLDVSPAGLIRLIRVLHARRLVRESREPLARIAYRCGFSDQAHLTRLFRHYFGSTPAADRRMCRIAHRDISRIA